MKIAIYILSLVLYPFLILAIEAGCVLNYIRQAGERDISKDCILLFSALCLLGIHYLCFALMAQKCKVNPSVHLLYCAFLLGIDATPFLYITIVCREMPLIIILQVILLGVRIFYTVKQLQCYRAGKQIEN